MLTSRRHHSLLQNVSSGHLRVHNAHGQVYDFPSSKASDNEAKAEIRVRSDAFWVRLCLMGDLGFSEAYMYGEVQCDDLVALFRVRLEANSSLERMRGAPNRRLLGLPDEQIATPTARLKLVVPLYLASEAHFVPFPQHIIEFEVKYLCAL